MYNDCLRFQEFVGYCSSFSLFFRTFAAILYHIGQFPFSLTIGMLGLNHSSNDIQKPIPERF